MDSIPVQNHFNILSGILKRLDKQYTSLQVVLANIVSVARNI